MLRTKRACCFVRSRGKGLVAAVLFDQRLRTPGDSTLTLALSLPGRGDKIGARLEVRRLSLAGRGARTGIQLEGRRFKSSPGIRGFRGNRA